MLLWTGDSLAQETERSRDCTINVFRAITEMGGTSILATARG